MIKKIIALAAGTLLSLNASAGYVQYNLTYGSPNSGLSGYIVQNDDQSIATFQFWLGDPVYGNNRFGASFQPSAGEGTVAITSATTYFRNDGPTNFVIHDSFGDDHFTDLSVTFLRNSTGGFDYTAKYTADLYTSRPPLYFAGTVYGQATQGTVNPLLATQLDEFGGRDPRVIRIVPTFVDASQVPEPTSLALLAVGALGVAGAARRRTVQG